MRPPDDASGAASSLRDAAWMARWAARGSLAPFSAAEIDALAAELGVVEMPAGTPLMREGDKSDHIGFIQSGEVELHHRSGGRRVVLAVLYRGDVYGDVPYLCDIAVPFGARALVDSRVVRLGADRFWPLLRGHPDMSRRFIQSLAGRLQRMHLRLLELTAGSLRSQLASLLLDETGGRPGQLELAQRTLAELLGASRPSVNQVLKEFEADGLVALAYMRIGVLDVDRLTEVARSA